MNKLTVIVAIVFFLIGVLIASAVAFIIMPGAYKSKRPDMAAYEGIIPAAQLLRVPVTGVYTGGTTTGLNPDMKNPLADDPDAVQRGMEDFEKFNCSGCHMPNGGGGMGPALSDDRWTYRESAANLYLDIAQGRAGGMPAWGAMLPDRTIWELVTYIQSISKKPASTFGTTTSLHPASPDKEQVPAEQNQSSTPWSATEPMPLNGEKPGAKENESNPDEMPHQ